jgi:hypothetical protein
MLSLQDIDNIVLNGGVVVDVAGEKIGSVEQIFTSGESGEPVFVTVRTGLFGMSESFAPLSGASLEESVIRVAFAKDTVKNGPRIESDRGAITETQEQELYSYYGLDPGAAVESSVTGSGAATGQDETPPAAVETPGTQAAAGAAHEGRADDGGERPVRQSPPVPRPLPHGGPPPPPPPPPHLHKHVPPHPHPVPPPHPGPHPPHPGPHPPHPPHH